MNMLMAAIEVMIVLESGGNLHAIGDGGDAKGCLQIHAEVIVDVNRIIGYSKYSIVDRDDPIKSREIAQVYLSYYCSKKRLGRDATLDDYVRCWNGGPSYAKADGKKLAKLNDYAERAGNLMEDQLCLAVLQKKKLQNAPRV